MPHRVALTNGGFALVDREDAELVGGFRWYHAKDHGNLYARTLDGGRLVQMHRLLLGVVGNPFVQVDHANHNGLDNRRKNIRLCTSRQNRHNERPRSGCSSAYKGVFWRKDRSKWTSFIQVPRGKRLYLGMFEIEENAALAYDAAAREHFGEFAYLNFPEGWRD